MSLYMLAVVLRAAWSRCGTIAAVTILMEAKPF
jgi:hypothetical protein